MPLEKLSSFSNSQNNIKYNNSETDGDLYTASGDKEILYLSTEFHKTVIHFFLDEFPLCILMDTHLKRLARKHRDIRFIRVFAQECPFLTSKFKIRILPTLLMTINGKIVDKLVGFTELSNTTDFKIHILDERLGKNGFLIPYYTEKKSHISYTYGDKSNDDSNYSDTNTSENSSI